MFGSSTLGLIKMLIIPLSVVIGGGAIYVGISNSLNEYKPSRATTILQNDSVKKAATKEELDKIKKSKNDDFISTNLSSGINNIISHTDIEFSETPPIAKPSPPKPKPTKSVNKPAPKPKSKETLKETLKETPKETPPTNHIVPKLESNLESNLESKGPIPYRTTNTHSMKY